MTTIVTAAKRPARQANSLELTLMSHLMTAGWPVFESTYACYVLTENGIPFVQFSNITGLYLFQAVEKTFALISFLNRETMKTTSFHGLSLGITPTGFHEYALKHELYT